MNLRDGWALRPCLNQIAGCALAAGCLWAMLATVGCGIGAGVRVADRPAAPAHPLVTVQSSLDPQARVKALETLRTDALRLPPTDQTQIATGLAEVIQSEKDPYMRVEIVRTLGAFPGAAATQALARCGDDESKEVRIACCQVWGDRHEPAAREGLARVVAEDSSLDVRLAAVRGLANHPGQESEQALAVALNDKDPALQYRAVRSLQKLTGRRLGNDVALWRDMLNSGTPAPRSESIAERFAW